ncbi:hypothetical protein PT974_06943 [Cladobotryum mycophilum]|uniref:Protein kinase domain-containing protein n=1 Tax=Cladobotryum mycophilum TaxID=491253 RepID=A0ABR0SP07_9HYPO
MTRTCVIPRVWPCFQGPRRESFGQKTWLILDLIRVKDLGDGALILVPSCYYPHPWGDDTDQSSLDAEWRHEWNTWRIWSTTFAYEQIKESHPRIVPYICQDPWTSFPILEKPTGGTLAQFLNEHRSKMYMDVPTAACRVLLSFRPLVLQWSLHLVSALTFVHKHSILYDEINEDFCWLSSSLSLSLAGFMAAEYRSHILGGAIVYSSGTSECEFNVRRYTKVPTIQTDIFWWGCIVYELMTGWWPGYGLGKSYEDVELMIPRREWPYFEAEYLGDIVKKCWERDYTTSKELMNDVIHFIKADGWEIENEDEMKGFNACALFESQSPLSRQ